MQLSASVPRRHVRRPVPASPGFTLIEILVTMVVVAIGILGLAKMQAAAVSETSTSRERSLVAMQAESLTSAMRADRGFWAATTGTLPGFSFAAGAATITYNGAFPTSGRVDKCISPSTPCSAGDIARADVDNWYRTFAAQFPTASGSLSCSTSTGPATCDLSLSWTERVVGVNVNTVAGTHSNTDHLVIHVQP